METTAQNSITWRSLRNVNGQGPDRTTSPRLFVQSGGPSNQFRGFAFDYIPYVNTHDVFCELWIAKCPLVSFYDALPTVAR